MAENKVLLTRNKSGTPHLEVYFEGGGEVPECLRGLYTSEKTAKLAIEKYLSTRKKKKSDAADSDK